MTKREHFELYLLSQLSARDLVNEILAGKSVRDADMAASAEQVRRAGLEEPGCPATAYRDWLGPPDATTGDVLPGTAFDGSLRHAYRLAPWPDAVYVFHEHPSGWVWGQGFEAADPARTPGRPEDLAAWRWTLDAVEKAARRGDVIDHWDAIQQIRFTLPGSPATIEARFDLGLLQSWSRAEP